MECAVCGNEPEAAHKASGVCGSCANLLGEIGPSGLEALARQQKRYAAQKELVEKLKRVNHRQAEDISGLDFAYKSADRDHELMRGEIAGLKNVDIPAFQEQLAAALLQLSEMTKDRDAWVGHHDSLVKRFTDVSNELDAANRLNVTLTKERDDWKSAYDRCVEDLKKVQRDAIAIYEAVGSTRVSSADQNINGWRDLLGGIVAKEKQTEKRKDEGLQLGESNGLPFPRPISDDVAKLSDHCHTCKKPIPAGDCRYTTGALDFCGRCGVPNSR